MPHLQSILFFHNTFFSLTSSGISFLALFQKKNCGKIGSNFTENYYFINLHFPESLIFSDMIHQQNYYFMKRNKNHNKKHLCFSTSVLVIRNMKTALFSKNTSEENVSSIFFWAVMTLAHRPVFLTYFESDTPKQWSSSFPPKLTFGKHLSI